MEALKTARLLAKHQGFTSTAAEGLLRTLATETLFTARDADQLRLTWAQLDAVDRNDPWSYPVQVTRLAQLVRQTKLASGWLHCGTHPQLQPDAVDSLAKALSQSLLGLEPEWLPGLDAATQTALRHPGLALALGWLWPNANYGAKPAACCCQPPMTSTST